MAQGVPEIRRLVDLIKSMDAGIRRAVTKAHLATLVFSEGQAKRNIKANFIGRNDRTLSGALLNHTYYGLEGELDGFVGVRTLPYAAAQEFGVTIVPKKAKHLWIPQYRNSGKMTPREFMRMKMQNPKMFFLSDEVAGRWDNPKSKTRRLIPLFFLVDKVTIPERPYLRPALELGVEKFPDYYETFLKQEMES